MTTRNHRNLLARIALMLSVVLVMTMGAVPGLAVNTFGGVTADGNYYTDFNTLEEAQAAAADIAKLIAAEGDTLLKNNGALPLSTSEFITIFGVAQDGMAGGAGNFSSEGDPTNMQIREALEAEGFTVNRTLSSYYATIPTSFGEEVTSFNKGIENSFGLYGDVAIVVLGRGGGEGSDMPTVTKEEADEEDLAAHTGYQAQADGKTYKHFLQLTASEKALLEYVKAQGFKKIVYLINSSEIFEMAKLQQDDAVDAILWIGRPGQVGSVSAAGILSGRINPSGKTVDTWYADFTADPTWQNAIDNAQVNSGVAYKVAGAEAAQQEASSFSGSTSTYYGVDYEEGIYVGYRYYETRGYTDGEDWYQNAVVYPFGYGLSYTGFAYDNMKVTAADGTEITEGAVLDAGKLSSSVEAGRAAIETLTVNVDVTNTGDVAGKETVEIYVQAPYTAGEVEKAHVKLVGFGKTDLLKPGQTQTLTIPVNVQDMASYDADDANNNGTKGYELDEGAYTLMAAANAHGWATPDAVNFQAVSFSLDKDAYLQLDDFSGNEIKNLFSKENGVFYSLRTNDGKYPFNDDAAAVETQLSRADWEGTFPKAPTEADLTMSETTLASLKYWDNFNADDTENFGDNKTIEGVVYEAEGYQTDYPWMADVEANAERMASWDQTGTYGIMLSEMSGIDPNSTQPIAEGRFAGKTGVEAWDEFMNTLTWQDEKDLAGQLQKMPLPAIGMNQLNGQDSAWNYAGTFNFTCNTVMGATWNPELSRARGTLIGDMALLSGNNTWWGNSANTHRSPFGGRVFEYPSEDGILGGTISAAETLGAVSRGLATYMKHSALNDQETYRNGLNLFAWVSEQAMREIYYKSFQLCAQEGQSTGVMGAFARAGRVSINVNYNYVTGLFRKEWGCSNISFTTDFYGAMRACSPLDLLVRAGTDNIATAEMSGAWDEAQKAVVLGDGVVSPAHWFATRECAKIFLWTHANTAMNRNGVDFTGWKIEPMTAKQGEAASLTVQAPIEADKVEYVILNGSLPTGLKMNADGTITGTDTAKAGTYNFTVQCRADNWVTANRQVELTVENAFVLDETEAFVDEDFYAAITSDIVNTNFYTDGVKYTLVAGELPEGLTLSENGEIEGAPEEAGEYTFTVNAAASYTVSAGWSRQTVTDNFEVDLTINVEE